VRSNPLIDSPRSGCAAVAPALPREPAGQIGAATQSLRGGSAAKSALLSLDAEVPGSVSGDAGDFGDTVADLQPSTEDLVESREMHDRVRSCLSRLPERHRYVVVGHLLEDRPMHELADHLGVTRSRASQLKAEAIHLCASRSTATPGAQSN
jgi:RNA polymerase sigma factor (sigma-70 family)